MRKEMGERDELQRRNGKVGDGKTGLAVERAAERVFERVRREGKRRSGLQ